MKHVLRTRLADSPSLDLAREVIAEFFVRRTAADITLTPKCEGVWFVDLADTGRSSTLVVKCGTKRRPFVFGTFTEVA